MKKLKKIVAGFYFTFYNSMGELVNAETGKVLEPKDTESIQAAVMMKYLQLWLSCDSNAAESVNSYAVKAYSRYTQKVCEAHTENEEDELDNIIDQADYVRDFYREYYKLDEKFSVYIDYAKRNELMYKKPEMKENNRLKASSVGLALTELFENGYLYLYKILMETDLVLKVKGQAKNDALKRGYSEYNKLYEFIRNRQDDKEYVTFSCALYEVEYSYRFNMIEKFAKEIVTRNISENSDFVDVIPALFGGIADCDAREYCKAYMGDNAQYIKTLAPNAIIGNLDTLSIDGSIDLALRIIEQSGSLEVFDIRKNMWIKDVIIQNLALDLTIAKMPIPDLRAMTEADFKAAKEFLQKDYKIVEGYIPAEIGGKEKLINKKFDCIRNIYDQINKINPNFQRARDLSNRRKNK